MRIDLIDVTADQSASYREINAFMARALVRFDKSVSIFWIHDYHFLPLGVGMRRLAIKFGRPPHEPVRAKQPRTVLR